VADYDAASDLGGQKLAERAPSEPDVFLSYAREDDVRARELAAALEQRGLTVFWDREVPPGQTWPSSIGAALASARCVVVAWSRHSIASQWVLEEASEGKDRNVLVPVLFETVPLPFGFRAIQAANLIDWEPGRASPAFDGLLSAVQRIVGGEAGSGMGPAVPDQPCSVPPPGQSSAWPRRTVLAAAVGLFAVAGGGGATLFWWLTQPERMDPTAAPRVPVDPEKRATRIPEIVATIKRFDDEGGLLTLEMELFNESTVPPRSVDVIELLSAQVIDERSKTSWIATHAGGELRAMQIGGGQRATVWAKFDLGPSRPEFLTVTANF
jgi:TIR domain